MSEPILEAFCQLAEDEIKRTPTLTSEMNLLLQGLKDAQPEETGKHYTYPVVEKHFKKILGEGSGVLADLVSLTADRLSWGVPYAEHVGEPDMDELRENYAFAPIIGSQKGNRSEPLPLPLYSSNQIYAGVVLQGPHINYPSHVHRAAEIYWTVAGHAEWQKGDEWSHRKPGSVLLHEPGVRHATVTNESPVLMLFAWVTNPESIPVIVRL